MQYHATQISMDGIFLEVLDIMLYAWMQDVDLKLLMNTRECLQLSSAADYLQGILPAGNTDLELRLPLEYAASWTIVITAADFEPTAVPSNMNHFLPCWPSGTVAAAEEKARVEAAAKHTRRAMLERLQSTADDDVVESIMSELEYERKKTMALLRPMSPAMETAGCGQFWACLVGHPLWLPPPMMLPFSR